MEQLIINYDETMLKVDRVHWLTIALTQNAAILLRHLKSNGEWHEVFDKMWGKGDNEESPPPA